MPLSCVFGLVLILAAGVANPASGTQRTEFVIESAFKSYARQTQLLTYGEVLTAEVPCGDDICLQFTIAETSRETAVKQFPHLVAGFGFGTDVASVEMNTDPNSYSAASVSVVATRKRKAMEQKPITDRVERVMVFLRILARMSDPVSDGFVPRKMAADQHVYFIYRLAFAGAQGTMTALLLSPPKASPPDRRKGGTMDRCHDVTIVEDGTMTAGQFADWKRFRVSSRWICNDEGKPIE